MSRICMLSGKRANFGSSRSHSNIATKRRQNVNLQVITINGQRVRLAASTIRTLKKYSAEAAGTRPTLKQKKQARNAKRALTAAK